MPGDHTQVKQVGAGSVLRWVTAGLRPAHRNVEREVEFSETVALMQRRYSLGEKSCHHIFKEGPLGTRDLGYVKGNSHTRINHNHE